jgi:hypothetical protein
MTSRAKHWPVLCAGTRAHLLTAVAAGLLVGATGCAQQVSTTAENTTTTTGTGAGGMGGSGGSGGAGGMGGSGGVPDTCTEANDCSALNGPCTQGACEAGKCVATPINNFQSCDDGDLCTTNDQCGQGECKGVPKSCGTAPQCKIEMCNPATGACEEMPGNNGAACDDGNPCTTFGKCQGGECLSGPTIDCSFLNTDCSIGYCDPVEGCKTKPSANGFACDDGLFCTINETCSNGVCGGGIPLPCAPPGGCFVGVCDESTNSCSAMPGNNGAACDDGSPCTAGTTCSAGVCGGGAPANDGMACNDGTSCTVGEICSAGVCGGGIGPQVYLSEDFSDNSAGWTLGPEWQIAPAKQGFTAGFAFPDPENDHTATADDGVAGVVIGGDASATPHDFYYLESPPFDTSSAQGPIILGYYRWLNSDGDPNMRNRVQVWNGNQWITVWATGDFLFESSWSYWQHDLTNYKNPQMRIRFGFDVGMFAFGGFSSWNIDDVLVASQACP